MEFYHKREISRLLLDIYVLYVDTDATRWQGHVQVTAINADGQNFLGTVVSTRRISG